MSPKENTGNMGWGGGGEEQNKEIEFSHSPTSKTVQRLHSARAFFCPFSSKGDGLVGFVCFPSCGHEATWSHGVTEKQSLGSDQVVHAQSKRWLWTGVSVHATRMLSWRVMRRGQWQDRSCCVMDNRLAGVAISGLCAWQWALGSSS